MKKYLIGCTVFPLHLALVALLSYILIYRKWYGIYKFRSLILLIILIASILTLTIENTISQWLSSELSYLTILGVLTGVLILPLIGLNNKNLKKLIRAEESLKIEKKENRLKFRIELKSKTKKQIRHYIRKRIIIDLVELIAIYIVIWISLRAISYWLL